MIGNSNPISKHFSLELLADGVYAAIHTDGGAAICNAGLIDLGNLLVVFDTFLTAQAARDLRLFSINEFGIAPQLVINSHYHNDHTWGNQVFVPDAQIISNTITRRLFETEGREEQEWYRDNSAQQLQVMRERFQNAKDEHERKGLLGMLGYYEGLVESMPTFVACKANITFEGKLDFCGKRRSAELISFAGAHTSSDAVLFLPADGIIFMGDLLFVKAHPYLSEGNPLKLIEALQAISGWGASCYVPGHGGIGTSEDVALLIEYVQYCIESTKEVIDKGSGREGLKNIGIPDKFANWQMPQMFQGNLKAIYENILAADMQRATSGPTPM